EKSEHRPSTPPADAPIVTRSRRIRSSFTSILGWASAEGSFAIASDPVAPVSVGSATTSRSASFETASGEPTPEKYPPYENRPGRDLLQDAGGALRCVEGARRGLPGPFCRFQDSLPRLGCHPRESRRAAAGRPSTRNVPPSPGGRNTRPRAPSAP